MGSSTICRFSLKELELLSSQVEGYERATTGMLIHHQPHYLLLQVQQKECQLQDKSRAAWACVGSRLPLYDAYLTQFASEGKNEAEWTDVMGSEKNNYMAQ